MTYRPYTLEAVIDNTSFKERQTDKQNTDRQRAAEAETESGRERETRNRETKSERNTKIKT